MNIAEIIMKGNRIFTVFLDYKYSAWCWAEGDMFLKRLRKYMSHQRLQRIRHFILDLTSIVKLQI